MKKDKMSKSIARMGRREIRNEFTKNLKIRDLWERSVDE
jgi:hypothetical protein